MRKENHYFSVSPQIVRANCESTVTIRPLYEHCRLVEDAEYDITLYPIAGSTGQAESQPVHRMTLRAHAGVLRVPQRFEGEQEHVLLIETTAAAGERKLVAELRLYSLAEDLFARRPLKGDCHIHTFRSDGWESPAYVAAASRRIGMDFTAITDHRRYEPSLEAIRALAGLPLDLRLYPGEEVHPPDCRVHLVNFGGRWSVNERFREDRYQAEVQAIAQGLPALPAGVERMPYAACLWCFREIRAAGGLGIFCHPYWISGHRYDVPEALSLYLLEEQPYDALELIGGYLPHEIESNALQVARYQEERARGRRIPIVGASDAHGCERGELFGWYYSLVFAPSPDLPDLIQSIGEFYSVAVEALPDELPRAHGPFRLVRYAQYLLREVLPLHDELCAIEGQLVLTHLAGDRRAAEELAARQGSVAALYARLWGQGG